jgi:hypothetical protein
VERARCGEPGDERRNLRDEVQSREDPTSVAPAPGTAASSTSFAPEESGMSTGMVIAGLVGVAVIAGIFIMRKK